jgi:hypothetical protein
MIGGMARLGKWFIDGGMRKGTPKKDHENVITVYGGTDLWKQRLGFQSPNAAYLLLVDQRGVLRWRHSGEFDEKAYAGISTEVAALLNSRH